MNLEIMPATPEEARVVFEVVKAAFEEHKGLAAPPGALTETLEQVVRDVESGCVLLAWREKEAVGTVRYHLEDGYLYVGRLAVLPTRRGEGIGAALMGYVERIAPGLGRHVIRLGTRRSTPSSIAFYAALGYTIDQEAPHSSGLDRVVWFTKQV